MDELTYFLDNKINEECGVFGIYNVKDAASLTYLVLRQVMVRMLNVLKEKV